MLSLSKDARRGPPAMLRQAQHDPVFNYILGRNEAIACYTERPCFRAVATLRWQ
jgi:hypothetical protein